MNFGVAPRSEIALRLACLRKAEGAHDMFAVVSSELHPLAGPAMSGPLSTRLPEINSQTSLQISSPLSIRLPEIDSQTSLQVSVPDFNFNTEAHLIEYIIVEDSRLMVKAAIDEHVYLTLTLSGALIEGGAGFRVEVAILQISMAKETARAGFIVTTFNALLALATEVCLWIPTHEIAMNISFDLSLLKISEFLQIRQTAYRLMVIERALGLEFSFPPHFSADEIAAINLTYRAIVERSIVVPIETYPLRVAATEEWLNQVLQMDQPTPITVQTQFSYNILGKEILLGDESWTIENAIIENYDDVKNKLALLDGHEMEIVIRSVDRQCKIEFLEAPRLPDNAWDSNIQMLIDLESQLDARLVKHYNALAAATLEGLSEEEKAAITARPELDEEAFAIEDWNKENL